MGRLIAAEDIFFLFVSVSIFSPFEAFSLVHIFNMR